MTVVGYSRPAGNASSSSSKPSTDSTDFLKNVVVEVVDLVGEQAERSGDEQERDDRQRGRRPLQDAVADPAPDPLAGLRHVRGVAADARP